MTTLEKTRTPSLQGSPGKLRVGLLGDARSSAWKRLFDSLAELYPVEFHTEPEKNGPLANAVIGIGDKIEDALAPIPAGLPALVFLNDSATPFHGASLDIRFSDSPLLHRSLQNQVMEDRNLQGFIPIIPAGGDEILATREGRPIWLRRITPHGTVEIAGFRPPALAQEDYLCEFLTAGRYIRLLPLLLFLRRLTKAIDWQSAGSRACFVFDDPSLYWTSYGFVDFRRLAEHAQTHNYYAAVATIPLDTWWSNPAALAVFREYAPRLSLMPHGNDHVKNEMARDRSGLESIAILAQALRRFSRLEQQGLETCRVMEAPYSAFAEATLHFLGFLDFDGALATPELLLRFNRHTVWPATLGMEPANMFGEGVPVLPRIKMTREWKTSVLLAAVIEQPIVLVGHHMDASKKFDLLGEFAATVNGISGVTWASPRGILRSNYKQIRDGESLHVRSYARRIVVNVPEDVRVVWVHRPWIEEENGKEILTIRCALKQEALLDVEGPVVGPIMVQPGETLEIASLLKNPIDYRIIPPPSLNLWPVIRKVLMEVRDRSQPVLRQKPPAKLGFEAFEKPMTSLEVSDRSMK